jgi:hypothetical protein
MKALKSILLVAAILGCAMPSMAQQKRVSPHETTGAVIDGNRVTVVYGRPYTKDPKTGEARKVWGGVVPYDKVWRLKKDALDKPLDQLMIGVSKNQGGGGLLKIGWESTQYSVPFTVQK